MPQGPCSDPTLFVGLSTPNVVKRLHRARYSTAGFLYGSSVVRGTLIMRSELDFDHARACGSSHWGRIDEILFVSIVQILPVKDTIACESVCRSWRSQLRDRPASSVWCSALALRDSGSQAGKFCDALFPQPLPAAAEQCFRLGEWVSQRAAGIGCLRLGAVNSSFTAVSDGALCVSHFLKGLKASAQPSILLTLSDPSPLLDQTVIACLQQLQCTQLDISEQTSAEHWQAISSLPSLKSVTNMHGLPSQFTPSQVECSNLECLTLGAGSGLPLEDVTFVSQLISLTYLQLFSGLRADDTASQLQGSFTQLSKLQCLEAHNFHSVSPDLSKLTSLHTLCLLPATDATHDLSGFSNLTHLDITSSRKGGGRIILPAGDHVQLQHLVADTKGRLLNLHFATALTRLELHPHQVDSVQWPYCLPRLKVLQFGYAFEEAYASLFAQDRTLQLHDPLPSAWQHYINLEYLRIPRFATQDGMPCWLPEFKHVKALEMPMAVSSDFLTELLQLTGLEILNLGEADMPWTEQVVNFATLPQLRHLNLGRLGGVDKEDETFHAYYSEEEKVNLDKLEQALSARKVKLERVAVSTREGDPVSGIYWSFYPPGQQPIILAR